MNTHTFGILPFFRPPRLMTSWAGASDFATGLLPTAYPTMETNQSLYKSFCIHSLYINQCMYYNQYFQINYVLTVAHNLERICT